MSKNIINKQTKSKNYRTASSVRHTNPINQSTNKSIQQNSNLMYINTDVENSSRIIDGYFPKNSVKAMAIKKVNKTLCGLLFFLIIISIISYYFVVSSEITLNEYSRQTTMLHDENADLQNKLDKLKSFSNVDITMQKNNLLQKPEQVIEAPEVKSTANRAFQFETERPFSWSIGY